MVVLACDPRERDRIAQEAGDRARVETVLEFKGLEADFVALAGIPSAPGSLESLQAEIYTGMTRAKIHLWVAVPSDLKSSWQSIREENASRMFAAEEEA
jgi:superfamily I DNA/RNA helicase